ncbi:ricin-type beta-trefoil lectin domain protein [Streptomyces sp. NPDC056373]|uniref:RICIN domain-containing protein n=1 Tax=Streptomyces sp. NPDC056373 TaxID=3345798 RepID=UPI0035DF5A08
MKDAGPSNSPASPGGFGVTDEQLSAELRKWTGATPALHPVGELLDRHWEAAFAYARLCTDGPRSAGMLTTAAFTRLFGETLRQNGPTSAWRSHLLVTVRRIAAEWAGDHRCGMLHPELLAGGGEGERPASRLLPSRHRRLLSGAFQRLPQSARCLLWHVEVEAEPLASPAALLGLDEEGARVELERARDRLREECLQLHRELAPDQECRRYLRLLDVTYRRGGLDIDPDLRAHIEGCGHCSVAADQLDQFNHGLGVALSEGVLGWGGWAYAESRIGEAGDHAGGGRAPGRGRPGAVAGAAATGAPAAAARELFPDPVALAREVFPEPAGMAYEIMPDPVPAAREDFPGPAGEANEVFPGPAGEAGEGVPGPTSEAREGFPAPPRAAREVPPGPAAAARKGLTGPAGAVREGLKGPAGAVRKGLTNPAAAVRKGLTDQARAARRGLKGPARAAREGLTDQAGAVREGLTDQAGAARRGLTDQAGAVRKGLTDQARAVREGLTGPARAARDGLADPADAARGTSGPAGTTGAVFPAPPRTARDAFPGSAGEGREGFPDPIALAGAVGESFTEPGGPAAVPPPVPRAGSGGPAGDAAQAPADAGRPLPTATVTPAHRSEGSRSAARRSARSAHKAARRVARRRNLTVGILTVGGLVVLPLVLWSTGDSGDSTPAGADRPAGEAPDPDGGSTDPSRTGAGDARQGALRGRLHNVASDLCVGIDGKKAVEGGEAELTTCSADAAQQWTYETDGLLRNLAAPDLCLDSQLGYSVRLAPCAGASRPDPKSIRYDFTLQGALVPRWDQDLALAPAATDGSGALVLKARTDDEVQRWVIDTSKADLQMQAVNWNATVPAARSAPAPPPAPAPAKTPEPTPTPSPASSTPEPTPSSPAATDASCYRYGYYCDSDGRYGNPGYGYPGYGYGHGGDGRR